MKASHALASPRGRLGLLAAIAIASVVAFMTVGVDGQWAFALPSRGRKLAALLLVGYAVALSTVLFQTITHNRILTPSIMGFDALYVFIQTTLVFMVGLERTALIDIRLKFFCELALMVVLAFALARWLFSGAARSLHLLMLVGIVFGIFFRGLTNFMMRLIDPNEFLVLQDRLFASFNSINQELLATAFLVILGVSAVVWRMRHSLDTIALGRDLSINLGIEHRQVVMRLFVLIAVLVAAATALVGPITFFGLVVANLAYQVMDSSKHHRVLPAAFFLGGIFLVGGQFILERLFSFDTALSVVVEFFGGLFFIALLLRRPLS